MTLGHLLDLSCTYICSFLSNAFECLICDIIYCHYIYDLDSPFCIPVYLVIFGAPVFFHNVGPNCFPYTIYIVILYLNCKYLLLFHVFEFCYFVDFGLLL